MREIRFRGKILEGEDTGKWAYGFYVVDSDGDHWIEGNDDIADLVDPETVGQFTGFHDMNSKELYDGDDIEEDTGDYAPFGGPILERNTKKYDTVMWHPTLGRWAWDNGADWEIVNLDKARIIGNTHDNPDLMEEK